MENNGIEQQAISFVAERVNAWKFAKCYVTPTVSYDMRTVIKRARKNYFGVFDNGIDEATGREKFWLPLTEHTVENVLKNIDLDTKDINVRTKNPLKLILATLNRLIIRTQLKKFGFGEFLDDMERQMAIDGTIVVKTWEGKTKQGKPKLESKVVDLLNFYIDPQAYSIDQQQDKDVVIERSIINYSEFKKKNYLNKDKVKGTKSLNKVDDIEDDAKTAKPKEVDLYYAEGQIPKSFITGNKDDEDETVFGYIIVSGIQGEGGICHKIEAIDKEYGNFEEAWYRRVHGRWYGRGLPEMLFSMQTYLNEVVNLRINNSRIFQLGLFKARKGSGVNNRTLQNLISGGVILVDQMADIDQFPLRNPNLEDSIQDEQNIVAWGQKVTHAYDISTGEQLPSETPATNAAIANQNTKTAFAMIQEEFGMFLTRLIERQWLPIIKNIVTSEDVIRITGEPQDLLLLDASRIENEMNRQISKYFMDNKLFPSQDQIEIQHNMAIEMLKKQGKDRFYQSKIFSFDDDMNVDIYVTNEDFDKNTILKNIENMIFNVSKVNQNIDTDALIAEYFDLLGMSGARFIKQANPYAVIQPGGGKMPPQQPPQMTNPEQQNANPMSPGQLIAKAQQQAPVNNL